jgi:hypothetical protein
VKIFQRLGIIGFLLSGVLVACNPVDDMKITADGPTTMMVGKTLTLSLLSPSNQVTAHLEADWRLSQEGIIALDAKGTTAFITAIKTGTTDVTAFVLGTDILDTITITVTAPETKRLEDIINYELSFDGVTTPVVFPELSPSIETKIDVTLAGVELLLTNITILEMQSILAYLGSFDFYELEGVNLYALNASSAAYYPANQPELLVVYADAQNNLGDVAINVKMKPREKKMTFEFTKFILKLPSFETVMGAFYPLISGILDQMENLEMITNFSDGARFRTTTRRTAVETMFLDAGFIDNGYHELGILDVNTLQELCYVFESETNNDTTFVIYIYNFRTQ